MSDDKNLIKDHEYDGIQEFDNPLPAWWLFTFLVTIIFGSLYWIHYEFGGGTNQWQELKEDLAKIEHMKKTNPAPADDEQELAKFAAQAGVVEQGKQVFAAKCAACHGQELQGIIGPNLVDEYWIHGKGTLSDIAGVIRKGVLDKGMPTWEGQLKDDEIRAVAAFIGASRGSQPANPKAPQGEKVVKN